MPKQVIEPEAITAETRWQQRGNRLFLADKTLQCLEAGVYGIEMTPFMGVMLRREKIDSDTLIDFPDSPAGEVLDEIEKFWGLKENFAKRGLIFKRGILLWGPHGSGKTTTVMQLTQMITQKHDGIALIIQNPAEAVEAMKMLRQIEPERPVIGLMEEVDSIARYAEHHLLGLLDGEQQVSNVVFVATTNYPERLPPRLTDRPSRFDIVKRIGMPSPKNRRAYLKAKEPSFSEAELEAAVKASEGYSFAYLKELIILTRVYEMPLKDAAKRLNKMRAKQPNSENDEDEDED